jgi:hypothetical protein
MSTTVPLMHLLVGIILLQALLPQLVQLKLHQHHHTSWLLRPLRRVPLW